MKFNSPLQRLSCMIFNYAMGELKLSLLWWKWNSSLVENGSFTCNIGLLIFHQGEKGIGKIPHTWHTFYEYELKVVEKTTPIWHELTKSGTTDVFWSWTKTSRVSDDYQVWCIFFFQATVYGVYVDDHDDAQWASYFKNV